MANIVGDRDTLLLGSSNRNSNPVDADVILQLSAPGFSIDSQGNALPSSITITAHLISLVGTVSFSASGGTITDNRDNTATLTYANLTSNTCTISSTITVNQQTFNRSISVSKITGAKGDTGAAGAQYATAYLYQYASTAPATPTGTSGYTWASGVNSTYNGNDQWTTIDKLPSNPGTPGVRLYVASVQITAPGGTASTIVSYTNASVTAYSQNGANGAAGAPGIQNATAQVYQWAVTIPTGPSGTASYTWATGLVSPVPTNWTATPGMAPSAGYNLYAAQVYVTDKAGVTQTSFNWTSAAIVQVGSSGANGAAGVSGASYVAAYIATTTGTTNTTPAQTTGKTSVPAPNDGGLTGTWYSTVQPLSAGQYLFQSDGIYDPNTNKVTWSIPYLSALKVGSLSAITANLGAINAGSIDLGSGTNSWHVDPSGNQWLGASSFASAPLSLSNTGYITATQGRFQNISVYGADGTIVLDAGKSLSSQTAINPNRVPRLSSWPSVNNASVVQGSSDSRFINGEYLYLPDGSGFSGASPSALGLPQNTPYTVSFDAYCDGATRNLNVDLFGGDVDTNGISVNLTNTITRYYFTESISSSNAPQAYLRVFCVSSGSNVVVSNIKVELGSKSTAWCDSFITAQNISTFIQSAAIGYAQISYINANQVNAVNLSAISAKLGNVVVDSGSVSSGQTAYNTGAGYWLEGVASGHGARFSLGDSNGKRFLADPANGVLGLYGADINGSNFDSFTAAFSGSAGGNYANSSNTGYGTLTANPSGGRAPYKYSWTLSLVSKAGSAGNMYISSTTTQSASFTGSGTNATLDYLVSCIVTDGNNRSVTLNTEIVANHGTPP